MDNKYLERADDLTDELLNYMELLKTEKEKSISITDLALVANILATEKTNALLLHIIELLTHPE